MSLETLREAILHEAEEKAHEIERDFQDKLQAEDKRIKEHARTVEEELVAANERRADQEVKRIHQEHQLEAKAKVLQAKQAELDALQASVIDQIQALSVDDQQDLIAKLLASLPQAGGSISVTSHHLPLVKQLVPANWTVEKTIADGTGGFIAHTATGDINLTVEALVKQVFAQHRANIARILLS